MTGRPLSDGSASCSTDAWNASRSIWRMVRSVADGTIAVRACHLEVGARRAADLVRVAAHAVGTPLLGEPLGDRLAHPRVAALDHRGRLGGGDGRGLHDDPARGGHL